MAECAVTVTDTALGDEVAYRANCDQCKLVAYGDTPTEAVEMLASICLATTTPDA